MCVFGRAARATNVDKGYNVHVGHAVVPGLWHATAQKAGFENAPQGEFS